MLEVGRDMSGRRELKMLVGFCSVGWGASNAIKKEGGKSASTANPSLETLRCFRMDPVMTPWSLFILALCWYSHHPVWGQSYPRSWIKLK